MGEAYIDILRRACVFSWSFTVSKLPAKKPRPSCLSCVLLRFTDVVSVLQSVFPSVTHESTHPLEILLRLVLLVSMISDRRRGYQYVSLLIPLIPDKGQFQ